VFRIKSQQPLPPWGQRIQLFFYGIASSIYRVFVGILIILTVTYSIPVLGPLMALSGVVTWLVLPVGKLLKYLTIEPELHRKRGRAWAFTALVAALLFLLIGVIPFPVKVNAEAIIQPKNKAVLYTKTPGFVKQIVARDGQRLKKGDVILVCRSEELAGNIERLTNLAAAADARYRGALATDMAMARVEELNLKAQLKDLETNRQRYKELTIRSPIDGYLVAPDIEQLTGRFLPEGQELFTVQETDTLEARGTVEQGDAQLLFRNLGNASAEVKLVSRFDDTLSAKNLHVFNGAEQELPHPSLSPVGGGTVPVDPKDESGKKAAIPQFELRADIANPGSVYMPGQRAYVKATVDKKPLYWHWYRDFLQVIQARSSQSKWM
jgi:putative peptide zinc metalloprotease protein